ncbi:MAG: peptidylprolyl isomerase [Elusimicrobia bacterium]|nr:peptidylprolyl isomerase [Elusimicrobiota bacterium]
MSNSSKAAALILALAAPAWAAKPAKSAPMTMQMEGTVAVVNGTPILLSRYQKEAATALDYWGKTNPAALSDPGMVRKIREGVLEQLITRELLVEEGKREGLKVRSREVDNAVDQIRARFKTDDAGNPLSDADAQKAFDDQLTSEGLDYSDFRARLERQILARKVIDENVKAKTAPPTDAEVRAYFDKIKAYIATGSTEPPKGMDEDDASALMEAAGQVKALSSERVRVSRILIRLSPGANDNERKRALKTAEDIKKKLDGGADFATLAQQDSEDPDSAARGGDIGYVVRGVAPAALEKAAFAMDVGQTSGPILTDSGYNIIRVTEKRAAETPQYDRFKDDLTSFLANVKFQKNLDAYVKKLRDAADIERHLPDSP